jgi:holo-[acyl-carrier protein] synthase
MMSLGVDCLYIARIERLFQRYGDCFSARILSERERAYGETPRFLAGRFSAKEAVAKALGTGIWRENISFHDIEILADERGKPYVCLGGGAKAAFERLGGQHISVSLSHERDLVVAAAVLEHKEA